MYEEGWAEYRKVRNRFWGLWLLYVPVVGGLTWLFGLIFAGFIAFERFKELMMKNTEKQKRSIHEFGLAE